MCLHAIACLEKILERFVVRVRDRGVGFPEASLSICVFQSSSCQWRISVGLAFGTNDGRAEFHGSSELLGRNRKTDPLSSGGEGMYGLSSGQQTVWVPLCVVRVDYRARERDVDVVIPFANFLGDGSNKPVRLGGLEIDQFKAGERIEPLSAAGPLEILQNDAPLSGEFCDASGWVNHDEIRREDLTLFSELLAGYGR